MIVKVEMTIETSDYDADAFEYEIEKLIADIDPETKILSFEMLRTA